MCVVIGWQSKLKEKEVLNDFITITILHFFIERIYSFLILNSSLSLYLLRVRGVSDAVGVPWLWFRHSPWPWLTTPTQVSTSSSAGRCHLTPHRARVPAVAPPAAPGRPWAPSAASYQDEPTRKNTAGPPASSPPRLAVPRRPPAASASRITPCAVVAHWNNCWSAATRIRIIIRPKWCRRPCPPRSSPGLETPPERAAVELLLLLQEQHAPPLMGTMCTAVERWWSGTGMTTWWWRPPVPAATRKSKGTTGLWTETLEVLHLNSSPCQAS